MAARQSSNPLVDRDRLLFVGHVRLVVHVARLALDLSLLRHSRRCHGRSHVAQSRCDVRESGRGGLAQAQDRATERFRSKQTQTRH